MNRFSVCFLLLIALISCKSKKKNDVHFFSIVPVLKGQVKYVDSSANRIMAIYRADDSDPDTSIISKEEFRALAGEFLSLPDITSHGNKSDYEESVMPEEATSSVLLNYTTTAPDQEIRRETVVLRSVQNPTANVQNGEVKSIIVDLFKENDDSTVIKNMLWQVDQEFQIVTKTTLTNQPEKVRILRVKWE